MFESFHFDYLKSQNLRSGELINNWRENFVDVCFSHQDRFFIVVDWFQWIDSMDDANDYLQFSNDSEMAFQNNQCYSIILRPFCEWAGIHEMMWSPFSPWKSRSNVFCYIKQINFKCFAKFCLRLDLTLNSFITRPIFFWRKRGNNCAIEFIWHQTYLAASKVVFHPAGQRTRDFENSWSWSRWLRG